MPDTAKTRLFSGMQPTGNLHIGNYLGALKTWSRVQYDYEPIYCIVDQHAITVYQEPAELQEKIEDVAAIYIAAGIDPEHSAVFVQSMIPAHVELAWVFTCVTPMGLARPHDTVQGQGGAAGIGRDRVVPCTRR